MNLFDYEPKADFTQKHLLTLQDWSEDDIYQCLSLALKLEALMNREYPGLSRGISLCTQRYNQHLTPLSLLAEFGAAGDTLAEALAAARDFAVSLAELLAAI